MSQAPPVVRQQRLVEGEGAQARPLSQQPGADAPGVQAVEAVSAQVGARQVPPMQLPLQQSRSAAQLVPSDWQQRPLRQRSAPQHPREVVQAPPTGRQQ